MNIIDTMPLINEVNAERELCVTPEARELFDRIIAKLRAGEGLEEQLRTFKDSEFWGSFDRDALKAWEEAQ